MQRVICVGLLAFCFLVAVAQAAETPAEEAIREAITILEARKAQAEKKEDQDKIAKAIADLEKLVPQAKKGADPKEDTDLSKLITPAILKKKFAGKAVFNPKTGELTLLYDFKNKDQFKDFDLGTAKPGLKAGMLTLEGGEQIKHIANFQDVSVKGSMAIAGMKGLLMKTTEGTTVGLGGMGSDTVTFESQGKLVNTIVPGNQRTGMMRFAFTVTPNRIGFEYGANKLGTAVKEQRAGQLELFGGDLGYQFGNLVFTGKPNPEWAKEFFKE